MAYELLCRAQAFYCALPLVAFTSTDFTLYERLRQVHRQTSKMDLRIAATALAHNAILVTRNTRDFAPIENLRLENWAND